MSSKRVEDTHKSQIDKLLLDSGVVCLAPPSVEEIEEESEEEEQEETEEEEEALPEVEPEAKLVLEETAPEELPSVFPSPSLRRMIPERLRTIEEQNRIHVLPVEFRTNINPADIPRINSTAQQKYIDILANIVGCEEYKSSLAEYWFLDTLANLLRRAQEDELPRNTQAVLILWFCEWMKEMQQFDAADRTRMLRRWKENMLKAAKYIAEKEQLPTPVEAGVYYKAPEEKEETVPDENLTVSAEEGNYDCSLRDLTKIIHYVYDLFGTDYQFDLVRSIFTTPPGYTLIDTPFQIQVPKRLYAPLPKGKPAKPEKAAKPAKGKAPPIVLTEEYLALMELKEREKQELFEIDEVNREEWNKRSHILPLSFAATEEFFHKYWPPPSPAELEAEGTKPPPPAKGKKGKK